MLLIHYQPFVPKPEATRFRNPSMNQDKLLAHGILTDGDLLDVLWQLKKTRVTGKGGLKHRPGVQIVVLVGKRDRVLSAPAETCHAHRES